jgi:hypothetical protein
LCILVFVPAHIFNGQAPEMEQLGQLAVDPQVFDWCTEAERNQPYVRGQGMNAFGEPAPGGSKLVLSEGWRRLQDVGFEKG